MTYLIEVPVDGGGRLVVQVAEQDLPGGLVLASLRPGEIVARAQESLEKALAQVRPAVRAVLDQMTALGPDEIAVEFGVLLGAGADIVIAKGTSEVHFTVGLTWNRPESTTDTGAGVPQRSAQLGDTNRG
jgi:hypothetical protein